VRSRSIRRGIQPHRDRSTGRFTAVGGYVDNYHADLDTLMARHTRDEMITEISVERRDCRWPWTPTAVLRDRRAGSSTALCA
jgi:hypothetical protein